VRLSDQLRVGRERASSTREETPEAVPFGDRAAGGIADATRGLRGDRIGGCQEDEADLLLAHGTEPLKTIR
jgi:hypothetical protein